MTTKYYHDEMLFSEIYLEEITRQPEKEDVVSSLNVLGEYRDYANTDNLIAWKDTYVHEVLAALGFFVKSIPPVKKRHLSEGEHLSALYQFGVSNQEKPLSVCYVLLPDEDLNNTNIGSNWAEKIIRALRENNLKWGLLTNGKSWRIYHLEEATPYETYLEIDLETILKEKSTNAFQIFYKFMKAENFILDEDGRCQFDRFKQESKNKIDYIEKELANALKQREEGGKGVLSDLCMGYVEELRNRGNTNLDDEAERKKIYHSAMLYMFRLLFLFYADARGLLSDNSHNLLNKVEGMSRDLSTLPLVNEQEKPLWDILQEIFVDIDEVYNGGLFSPQESVYTRFISELRIGDSFLSKVIFNLTNYQERGGEVRPISYRDMSVRHLGTLYEGLLEHNLYIAEENTQVKVSKGKIEYIPVSQGGKLKIGQYIPVGMVYFSGDSKERKSSGSYYTPENVVDYIVRNTISEKLLDLESEFLKQQETTIDSVGNAINENDLHGLTYLLESVALEFIKTKILNISVLDPAMGSGHFLVNATNSIANFITEFLNDLDIRTSETSSTLYWRRRVVENCIYGVDINPLAVELAKLSLWILSMAKNMPLSYLNHHLKCGNSLIGARINDIGTFPLTKNKSDNLQLSLFSKNPSFISAVEGAVEKARLIAKQGSDIRSDVEAKTGWQEDLEQALVDYKSILNVHTGIYFDQSGVNENHYLDLIKSSDFSEAKKLEKDNDYFHWELEFPSILFGQEGFDCVIGNPPYVDVSSDIYTENNFKTSQGRNLYNYFLELGLRVLNKKNGYFGFIIPISIITSDRMKSTRDFIRGFPGKSKFINIDSSAHPGTLFSGLNLRLSITLINLTSSEQKMRIFSSDFTKFFNVDRELFIPLIETVEVPNDLILDGIIPKIGSQIEVSILRKMLNTQINYFIYQSKNKQSSNRLFYKSTGYNYMLAHKSPPFFEVNGKPAKNSKTKEIALVNDVNIDGAALVYSSSLFYWFWTVYSNCFDFTNKDLRRFPIDLLELNRYQKLLEPLYDKVTKDLEKHGELVAYNKVNGPTKYFQYRARYTKPLFDEVDDILGQIYGFTDDELYFIKNYDLKFRTDENE